MKDVHTSLEGLCLIEILVGVIRRAETLNMAEGRAQPRAARAERGQSHPVPTHSEADRSFSQSRLLEAL